MTWAMMLQARMVSGRRARIELKDVGLQPEGGLAVRCRMMLEGDDESVHELMSRSLLGERTNRYRRVLEDLAENGIDLRTISVLDAERGFEVVIKPAALRKLGMA